MTDDQCQAATWSNYGYHGSYHRCEKAAKFDGVVGSHANNDRWGEYGEPYSIRLCGVHNNQALRGSHFHTTDGSTKTDNYGREELVVRDVRGVKGSARKAKEAFEQARWSYQSSLGSVRQASRAIGEAIARHPEMIASLWAEGPDDVQEAIKAWHAETLKRDLCKTAYDKTKEAAT